LSWADQGCWRPVVHGVPSLDAIVGEVLEDKATWRTDPAFLLAYDDTGEGPVDLDATGTIIRDLKPKPRAMRTFLENLARQPSGVRTPEAMVIQRRSLDTAAAFGCELIQDNNGNTKPTAFHFSAGQQQFMKAVAELQDRTTAADFVEALAGPWRRERTLPNMGWDATDSRLYALRATNPSGEKKTSIPGADWLAFVGLGAFPSFPVGGKLATTGVKGGWKDSVFTWPIWTRPALYSGTCGLLRTLDLRHLSVAARRARSVGAVFTARIGRSDQGGYGTFSPAAVS
jgi:hypothetical protein